MILSSELRITIDNYGTLFGFKPEYLGAQRVVIRNAHFKIIFLGQHYSIDVLLSDISEKNQVDLPSLVRFLFPHLTLDHRSESDFDSLIKTNLPDVLVTWNLNWEEVMAHQNEKKLLHQYIVSNYEPDHELMRLMNSGSEWVAKVKKYLDDHGNKLPESQLNSSRK